MQREEGAPAPCPAGAVRGFPCEVPTCGCHVWAAAGFGLCQPSRAVPFSSAPCGDGEGRGCFAPAPRCCAGAARAPKSAPNARGAHPAATAIPLTSHGLLDPVLMPLSRRTAVMVLWAWCEGRAGFTAPDTGGQGERAARERECDLLI